MSVTDVSESHGMKTGVIGGRRLYLHDVAWALKCMLQDGVTQKFHAGCNFVEHDGEIYVQNGYDGATFTEEEARQFIDSWL